MFSLFSTWAEGLRTKCGWRRYAWALLYGAVAALALPPFNAVATLWFCFPALVFLLQGTPKLAKAFAVGWCFSLGFLVVSLYWIAGALFVDIETFWWAVPLAVVGLPAAFAFYYGFAALLARWWGLERLDGLLILALCWSGADYARGHLFTGFPWDVVGYAWGDVLSVLQITSVIGIYGLTLVTLALVILPAMLFAPVRSRWATPLFLGSLVFLGVLAGWGEWRLATASEKMVANVRLRLVQPNVDQSQKWLYDSREDNFQRLLNLSFAPAEKPITHVVWPETATVFYLAEDPVHRTAIEARLNENQTLITGVVRREREDSGATIFFNSLIAIDSLAGVVASYDKHHLVPFGEYIPFRSVLPFHAVAAVGDFRSGDGVGTLRVAGLPPFSPLVCYEAIFPNEVVSATEPPRVMINVTNDAWYKGTTGPYQHFAITRVRAIEEGVPLVRVANMGVVAVVDPFGKVKARLGWGHEGVIDSDLPEALVKPTIYSRWRHGILWGLVGLFIAISCVLKNKARK